MGGGEGSPACSAGRTTSYTTPDPFLGEEVRWARTQARQSGHCYVLIFTAEKLRALGGSDYMA